MAKSASKQPYFEDVKVGDEVPRMVKGPITLQDLVEWCSAEEDYNPIHYDEAYAKKSGLPGTVIQGWFKYGLMGVMLTDWLGEAGTLKKLGISYRGLDYPGDTLTFRGKVTGKSAKGQEKVVELEVWVENQRGEKTTPGTATVTLPART
ncbi:MAG: MaoC/PaaZ C-terminal domain-containing protein [Chloroflexota bacterium]|nr:MaoC/PaaZ C-terminal domain-containing protein [Chloroflexota bacterium]